MRASRSWLAGSASLIAAGGAGLAYAAWEARAFTLREFTVPVLPPDASSSIRLLHVSDLHILPRQGKKLAWVRRLAELEPDLVISTGDNIAGTQAVEAALEAQSALLDRPGAFVLGSNDYYAPKLKSPARYLLPEGGKQRIHGVPLPTDELVAGLRSGGWLDLSNRRGTLDVAGLHLELVGVDDPHLEFDRYAAVSRPADPSATLTVGVMHAPYRRVLDGMAADGARLLLAGHTHGGQLCLPGIGTLVTNCDLDRRRARGLSRWPVPGPRERASLGAAARMEPGGEPDSIGAANRMEPGGGLGGDPGAEPAWLHVSAGLGTSPYTPVRFACRPEATLLTLVPAPAAPTRAG